MRTIQDIDNTEQREHDKPNGIASDGSADIELERVRVKTLGNPDPGTWSDNGIAERQERRKRNVVLDDCLCRNKVDPYASNAIQCK
jgi:hypothetical protein